MPITALFPDIGGVLLTNGWDRLARKRGKENFKLQRAEIVEPARPTCEIHEKGKLTSEEFAHNGSRPALPNRVFLFCMAPRARGQCAFQEYLSLEVYYQEGPFTRAQFRLFMCGQSNPYAEMTRMVGRQKARRGRKIAVVSNESLELSAHRIQASGIRSILHTDCKSTRPKLASFGL